MKKLTTTLIVMASLLFGILGFGQLTAGDIAIVEVNSDGKKPFAFITLVPIPANEIIKFTDNGWKSDNTWRTGEGIITWTAPATGVSCGTVIHIDNPTSPDTANPFKANIGTVTKSGSYNYSASGDQLIAYQGTSTMIAGFNSNSNNWVTTGTIDTSSSYIPSGLINDQTCISIGSPSDTDNHKYKLSITDTKANILTSIYLGNSNWDIDDTIVQNFTNTIIVEDCCSGGTIYTYTNGSWSPSGTPTTNDIVIIDDTYTATTSIEACTLSVTTSGSLTIPTLKYVKTIKNIYNQGTIIVEHEGSIVQENDNANVTGTNFQIEKTTTPYKMYDYTYWSSPIENADMSLFPITNHNYYFDTVAFEDVNSGAYPQTTAGWDSFDDDGNDWVAATGTMTVAKGYIAMGAGANFPYTTPVALPAQDVTFIGKINNGDYSIDVFSDQKLNDQFKNQNLIGNPYPSAIDLKVFYNTNKTTLVGGNSILTGTFNFWTHNTAIGSGNTGPDAYNFTNADYAMATYDGTTLNLVAGGNGLSAPEFIASGQGFFVDVEDAGTASVSVGSLVFNNSMRVTGNNDNFQRSTTNTSDRVWVNMITDNNTFRQILVGFFANATDNVDRGIDGKRMFNGTDYGFYSLLNNERYGIQGFPILGNDKVVPLGITAPNTGDVTLSIDRFEGDLANVNIYIRDLQLNTLHNLKISDYTFNMTQTGTLDTRFELVFSRSVLSTTDTEIVKESDLIVSNQNDAITFNMLNGKSITTITGFDILGKSIIQENNITTSNYSINSNINSGTIVFFKVTLENGQTLTKKFIKQ